MSDLKTPLPGDTPGTVTQRGAAHHRQAIRRPAALPRAQKIHEERHLS